jgi:trehalose 6-phosphate phosphatase
VIPALGAEGRQQITRFLAGRPLLAFDIDGTLAPIVAEPDGARIPDALQDALRRLASRAPVVILTGRSRTDAQRMVAFTPAFVLGNHGIEGLPGHEARTAALADTAARWRALLDVPEVRAAGVLVEDKRYSLSLHYRHAADHAAAVALIDRRIATLAPGPLVIHGKCVVNVLPPGAITKGDALRALLAATGTATAVYAGDDDTDEHVFELPHAQVLGVRVGVRPVTGAQLFVDTPADMLPLVEVLNAHWPDAAPRA